MIKTKYLVTGCIFAGVLFSSSAPAQQFNTINVDANQIFLQGQTISGLGEGTISATSTEAVTGSQIDAIIAAQAGTDQWQTDYILSLQNTANIAAGAIYGLQLENGAQENSIFNLRVGVNEANARIDLLSGNTAQAVSILQDQNAQQQSRIDTLQDDANVAAGSIYSLQLENGAQQLSIFNIQVRNNEQDALIAAANQNAINSAYIDINSTGGIAAAASGNNAVALGNGASAAHDNSVAIGAGSTTTAANQVNVGGRTIGGVAAGAISSTSTDAVNGAQLSATNSRVAGLETGLQAADARIDTLEQLAIGVTSDLRRLDDKLKGSTAIAIAMSGNAFLPGKSVNITGNVGTFDGAFAGSLQFGAMVSPNAAVNAGIAANFNKKGGVGGRAGFTVGW